MKRLNTDQRIAPIVTQFVPLKMDTSTKEWQQWAREYRTEGNSIPILYVVRADGEMLYGASGSLTGDKLPTMLVGALRHSGQVLSAREATAVQDVLEKFNSMMEEGDRLGAVKTLSKIKKLGTPGQIESYAAPVVEINEAVNVIADETIASMKDWLSDLQGDDAEKQAQALLSFYQAKREVGTLRSLKSEFTKFNREVSKLKDLKDFVREVKLVDAARITKSKTSKSRSVEKLELLIKESPNDAVVSLAKEELSRLKSELEK